MILCNVYFHRYCSYCVFFLRCRNAALIPDKLYKNKDKRIFFIFVDNQKQQKRRVNGCKIHFFDRAEADKMRRDWERVDRSRTKASEIIKGMEYTIIYFSWFKFFSACRSLIASRLLVDVMQLSEQPRSKGRVRENPGIEVAFRSNGSVLWFLSFFFILKKRNLNHE